MGMDAIDIVYAVVWMNYPVHSNMDVIILWTWLDGHRTQLNIDD